MLPNQVMIHHIVAHRIPTARSKKPARLTQGLGLVSISERVRLAGGTVSVVTELNSGTRLHVEVPANHRAAGAAGTASGSWEIAAG